MAAMLLPEALTTAGFLDRYWQKRHLMMPGALPEICTPFTPEQIVGLACDSDMEARLAWIEDGHWHLRPGPFEHGDFTRLERLAWTVLVQDIEKHFPDLQALLRPFSFLPRWRIEDLMISLATPGGGVGPHLDNYDVFLVQLSGRRRWQVDTRGEPAQMSDTEGLRQVGNFHATQTWEVARGDVLYLPPGLPHCGTALAGESPCITLSVGLRAPGADELLHSVAEALAAQPDTLPRYCDPDLGEGESFPGLISAASLQRARALLQNCNTLSDAALAVCFGRLVTEPKNWLNAEPREQVPGASELVARAKSGVGVKRHPFALMAWCESGSSLDFFVDGEHMNLTDQLKPLVLRFCADDGRLDPTELRPWLDDMLAIELILHLLSVGKLIFEDE